MQRLHADDLVAHLQETESWDVLSLPAIAETDERYSLVTPYGQRLIQLICPPSAVDDRAHPPRVSVFRSFETAGYGSKLRLWPIFGFSLGCVFLVVQASFLDGFPFDPFSP